MLLEGYRKTWREFSGLASDNARKLGFAGIATIWVFRTESATKTIPGPLLIPALLIVLALTFDLLQYVVSAVIYGAYQRRLERQHFPEDKEVKGHPRWFNWPNVVFLWGKLIMMIAAYVGLISFLWRVAV